MSTIADDLALKPFHKILSRLTGEDRFDVALHLATKELVQLKLQVAQRRIEKFESQYGMDFEQFQQAWERGQIPNTHSYEVEKDYWEWEAALTDKKRLDEIQASLL